jgi:hypothetical protein
VWHPAKGGTRLKWTSGPTLIILETVEKCRAPPKLGGRSEGLKTTVISGLTRLAAVLPGIFRCSNTTVVLHQPGHAIRPLYERLHADTGSVGTRRRLVERLRRAAKVRSVLAERIG